MIYIHCVFSPADSVQCLASTYSSSSSPHCFLPCSRSQSLSLFPPAFHTSIVPSQVQQSRSTWQKRGDWVGRDVEVVGSEEEDEEEEAVVAVEEEARREG